MPFTRPGLPPAPNLPERVMNLFVPAKAPQGVQNKARSADPWISRCWQRSAARPAVLCPALLFSCTSISATAGEITVSAASSLTQAFTKIAEDYEARYPEASVSLNFAASGALLAQIGRGAPVDVLATADQETMNRAGQQGLIAPGSRQDFTANQLVVITPVDSRLSLTTLVSLRSPDVQKIALGNPASVPAGRYAKTTLESTGHWNALSGKFIHTENVRQSLDYVSRGEVDAGFVYATDAFLGKDKVKTAFQVPAGIPVTYPIALTRHAGDEAEARRFIAHVLSPEGQAVLKKFGFRKP